VHDNAGSDDAGARIAADEEHQCCLISTRDNVRLGPEKREHARYVVDEGVDPELTCAAGLACAGSSRASRTTRREIHNAAVREVR
jgi:hypothetical protein